MSSSDKCQDASAFLLAKFMYRQDLKNTIFPEFFQKLFEFIKEAKKIAEVLGLGVEYIFLNEGYQKGNK